MKHLVSTGRAWLKAALPILILFLLYTSCKTRREITSGTRVNNGPAQWNPTNIIDSTQVMVWQDPSVSGTAFQQWLDSVKHARPDITLLDSCANCDNNMQLLNVPNPTLFLQSSTAGTSGGSKNPSGLSGGSGNPFGYACRNLGINIPTMDTAGQPIGLSGKPPFNPAWPAQQTNTGLVVAVFDSGLGREGAGVLDTAKKTCLIRPGVNTSNGWNFVDNTNNTIDTHPNRHGTKVTKLLVNQALLFGQQDLKILPVKVFDDSGRGDLFHILCGVAYAANAGAKIINASFGFYKYTDSVVGLRAQNLMHHFLEYYLDNNGMLLVAAAGNDNPLEDAQFPPQTSQTTLRDLALNPFYPASFAATDSNIIAVTTVSAPKNRPAPNQNYSNQIVDIGTDCDVVGSDGEYDFFDPLSTTNQLSIDQFQVQTVNGSSFATPIFTGRLAALYATLPSQTNKQLFIPAMNILPAGAPTALQQMTSFSCCIVNQEITVKR